MAKSFAWGNATQIMPIKAISAHAMRNWSSQIVASGVVEGSIFSPCSYNILSSPLLRVSSYILALLSSRFSASRRRVRLPLP